MCQINMSFKPFPHIVQHCYTIDWQGRGGPTVMIYVEYFKDWLCGNTRASPLSKTPMEEQTVGSECMLLANSYTTFHQVH